jgi:predicted ATPase
VTRRRSHTVASPVVPGSPFLTLVTLGRDRVQPGVYPFNIPLLRAGLELAFSTPVTLLGGENGSGKSTLLEALAWAAGFGAQGGNRDHAYGEGAEGHALGRTTRRITIGSPRISWTRRSASAGTCWPRNPTLGSRSKGRVRVAKG